MEKLLEKIANSKMRVKALKIASAISTVLIFVSFLSLLYVSYKAVKIQALYVSVICGVPFVLVSLFRHFFNAPRPYELYDFYKEPPKNKKGKSFPSRHVFSGFVIATTFLVYSVPVGIMIFLLSVLLSVARVLLGIHFIRDCVCGALIGVSASLIGLLVFNFI